MTDAIEGSSSTIVTNTTSTDSPPNSGFDSSLIFLGTGVSTALPQLQCILKPDRRCPVCLDGWTLPNSSPNRRGNVAVLLRDGVTGRHVLVDCGKTIRDSALRWLPEYGIGSIDALMLTHGHFDAIGGMDDLRDFQDLRAIRDRDSGELVTYRAEQPMPVMLTRKTMETCRTTFPYLVRDARDDDVPRRIADLTWTVLEDDDVIQTVDVLGTTVTCMPLWHGGRYISLGFAFGVSHSVVHLSDVHEVPPQTMEFLVGIRPRIQLLIVDSLSWYGTNSHFSVHQALDLIARLRPVKARLVGMTCSIGLHDKVNAELARMAQKDPKLVDVDIQLASDGARVLCNLHN